MEDTIQKGELEPDEEAQSENERIVEEFLRQNQETVEPELPEDYDSGSDKVIQWVEQSGAAPAYGDDEVPERYDEIMSDEEASFVPEAHFNETAEPVLDGTDRGQAEPGDTAQLSEEDPSYAASPAADRPVGLGSLVNDDAPDIESPAVVEASTEAEFPALTTPPIDGQAAEEPMSGAQAPVEEDVTLTPGYPARQEPAFTSIIPEDEEPEVSPSPLEDEEPALPAIFPDNGEAEVNGELQVDEPGTPGIQTPLPGSVASVQVMEENEPEPPARKIALVLSGGGARGAFQVGAEKYAREVKGYHWDIIAGVSVGAMNGAMLSMHRYARLMQIWDHLSDDQVYTGGFNLLSLLKLAFGSKSFYGNGPLQKLMQHEFEAGRIIDDLHVGAVSLHTGEYMQFTRQSLELAKAILASASIPVVWPPVNVSAECAAMVDGGVRNITPVGDVLALEPDEIVIINCGCQYPALAPEADSNVVSIGLRALDIMQNEIFNNDMKTFLRTNALVQEAEKQGCFLHHPKSGKLLKYYPCQVIEPVRELGDTLDFSQKSIQAALRAGVRRAREVLGRP